MQDNNSFPCHCLKGFHWKSKQRGSGSQQFKPTNHNKVYTAYTGGVAQSYLNEDRDLWLSRCFKETIRTNHFINRLFDKKTPLILQNGPLRDEMKQSKQLNQLSRILLLEGWYIETIQNINF